MLKDDKGIVLTLDAGGTNFVFGAIQGGEEIVGPIGLPSNGSDLALCTETLFKGFQEVIKQLTEKPVAISFAFPGPADYPNGIIGDLWNLPGFRGGVPLKAILENHFNMPVFINNDGDLFAYGEAIAGILPEVNAELEKSGSTKRYKNLIGVTLGTGFGGGIVLNGKLLVGDNSSAAEVWIMGNRNLPQSNAEEGISIRAVQRAYAYLAADKNALELTPKDIFDIASGTKPGNKDAAIVAFEKLGHCLGDSLANLLTIVDGIAVIGGGLTGASEFYMPAVMDELNNHFFINAKGDKLNRIVQKVFNIDNPLQKTEFLKNYSKQVVVPGTDKKVFYDPVPRLAIATSKLGASRAISLGAYAFALDNLK
ncbi:MAG: ROK family protein [Bacteroidales bacterium]|nr:ROK family protein [Bacteroidales bacterium]